jgi:hypothetical protein
MFRILDIDYNGVITKEEIIVFFSDLDIEEERIDRLMKIIDLN